MAVTFAQIQRGVYVGRRNGRRRTVKLRCGRCGKVVDVAWMHDGADGLLMLDRATGRDELAAAVLPALRRGYRLPCHDSCGERYDYDADELEVAVVGALDRGSREIVLGYDL